MEGWDKYMFMKNGKGVCGREDILNIHLIISKSENEKVVIEACYFQV